MPYGSTISPCKPYYVRFSYYCETLGTTTCKYLILVFHFSFSYSHNIFAHNHFEQLVVRILFGATSCEASLLKTIINNYSLEQLCTSLPLVNILEQLCTTPSFRITLAQHLNLAKLFWCNTPPPHEAPWRNFNFCVTSSIGSTLIL